MSNKQVSMDDSKELQVINEKGEVVDWNDLDIAWDLDGTEDIQPSFPMVRIVQATSTMAGAGRNGGTFYHSDREEFETEMTCVALVRRNTRALFEEGNDKPACMSPDGRAPFPNQPAWEGREQPSACAECPFSQWGEDGTPPACKESDMLLIDRGNGDLAQFRVGGKSLKPLRNFIKRAVRGRMVTGPNGQKRPTPLYFYRLTLTTEENSGNSRKWYELVIKGEQMSPAEIAGYSDLVRASREQFGQSLEHQPAEQWPSSVGDDDWTEVV